MFKQMTNLAQQTYDDSSGKSEMLFEVLSRIDYRKMMCRIWDAMSHPEYETKCVLFEYNWTNLRDVRENGLPNIVTRVPCGRLFHDEMIRLNIFHELQHMFENPRIQVYRRRKVVRGIYEDPHTIQVVLVIQPYAFLPRPNPVTPRQVSSMSSETCDWSFRN